MKFLCILCDEKMETQVDGIMPEEKKNLAMKFKCKKCGHSIAMLTNKFETEFVSKLGVQMGGTAAEATAAPMGVMAGALAEGKDELKKGTRLNQIMRHTLGLFHGQTGASYWKRYLSENMCVRDADVQKIDHIMDKIKYNNFDTSVGQSA